MKNFVIFKDECLLWIEKLRIDHWGFEIISKKGKFSKPSYATINVDGENKKASICFYADENIKRSVEDIKSTAKHEIMHLLIGDFSELANKRYITEDEILSCEEALVQKLSRIIK